MFQRRLVLLTIVLTVFGLGMALIVLYLVPPGQQLIFSIIALVLLAAAIVAVDYFIIKPYLLTYASRRAREICLLGHITNPRECDDIARALSKSHNSPEASRLLKKLDELKDKDSKKGEK